MAKRIIVLSADALVHDDMETLEQMPNFRKYLSGGSCIKQVKSIYPTITYPCHTTMATGVYPDRHGIVGNLKSPYRYIKSPIPWTWEHEYVKVPDLFDAAKKAGLTTAAVFWPVTGNHPSIDYLIDEYWTQKKDETYTEAFHRMGTKPELFPIIERHASVLVERKHPMCDNFIVSCAADIIREFKPHLMMLHPANIDGYRHGNGLFGSHIRKGLEETDRYIGELMAAAEDAGVAEETSFVLTSDHGQLDIKRVININVYLADAGLIRPREGADPEWDAWCQSGGMSACVYLKNREDKAVYEKVYSLLRDMCAEGIYGISRVYTAEEAEKEERFAGDFSFVLETDGYTSFGDKYIRPVVSNINKTDYRSGAATHGYLPSKGPCPVFYANGPLFRKGVVIETGKLVDEAPTLAKALGIEMPGTDGEAVTELLA